MSGVWGVVPQALVSGLLIGGVYGLMALGLTMIFGVLRIINFAHGSFVMLGMCLRFWGSALSRLAPYLSLPVGGALFLVLGALVQAGPVRAVVGAPQHTQL